MLLVTQLCTPHLCLLGDLDALVSLVVKLVNGCLLPASLQAV